MEEQLRQLMQAVLAGDQNAIQQFQQILQDPQQGEQVIQVIQSLAQQGDPDAQQFIQLLSQQQTQSAKLGAKLRTIKTLRGLCPEGFELQTFKIGGKICKKCMKKEHGGEVVETKNKKLSPADEFKKTKTPKDKTKAPVEKKLLGGKIKITPEAVNTFKSLVKK
ncbi:MAG: hypothetical protein Nk1A_8820 [Endomicrobiia bacterium]|nr:MAG: hypothetical protein Nk1A_8820 [Endomicrobiia bacterium]